MTMAELARQLGLGGYGIDRQVVNETELSGAYDFEFDYLPPLTARGEAGRGDDASAAADLPAPPGKPLDI